MRGVFAGIVIVVLLSACQTMEGGKHTRWPAPEPTVEPAPTPEPRPPNQAVGIPVPIRGAEAPRSAPEDAAQARRWPQKAEDVSGPAVVSLIQQARQSRSEGRPDLAAAHLERAARIESRNGFVWMALAEVYIDQGVEKLPMMWVETDKNETLRASDPTVDETLKARLVARGDLSNFSGRTDSFTYS